jgi:putative ABC transport system permease protein
MMPIRFLILKQWRQRPLRIAITIISVVIAVATLLGSRTAQRLVREAETQLQESLQGKPALEVTAAAGGRFDPALVKAITVDPRISKLTPLAYRTSIIRANGRKATVLLLGTDLNQLSSEHRGKLESGTWPVDDEQILLDASYARQLQIDLNDEEEDQITVIGKRGPRSMTVVGLLKSDGLKELRNGAVVLMPITALQDMFDLDGQVDRVRLEFNSAAQPVTHAELGKLIPELQPKLPGELQLRRPESLVVYQEEMMRATDLALNFATALSFVMALFLVLNTLRMNFFERRRELAIVRAIGSSARQIAQLLLSESVLIGLIGAILGIPAGWGLAKVLQLALKEVLHAELGEPRLTIQSMIFALLFGIITVVIGAWFTIRQARKISPVEAMRDHEPATSEHYSLKLVAIACVSWVLAVTCLLLLRQEKVPAWVAIPAGNLMLISFLVLIPVLLPPLLKFTARVLFFPFPVFGLLAVEQLNRRRIRTGLTVGVLVVAISSGLGLGNAISNNIDDVYAWQRRSMFGEYFLKSVEGTTTEDRVAELLAKLDELPQLAERSEIRFRSCKLGELAAICMIRDLPADQPLPWNLPHADEAKLRTDLNSDKVVLSSVLARRANLRVGDTVAIEMNTRIQKFPVAGIVQDYINGGMILTMTTETAKQKFNLGLPNVIILKTKGGPPESQQPLGNLANNYGPSETQKTLAKLADDYGWALQSWSDVKANLDKTLNGLVAALWALIAVGFVVGGLGIMNTLTMNILEQTREIGLLRVLGMSKKQTLVLVFVQVILIVAMGILLGASAGITTAYVIDWVSMPLLAREVPFHLQYDLIWFNLGICVVIALVSAVLPAIRAVRVRMITAVAYE